MNTTKLFFMILFAGLVSSIVFAHQAQAATQCAWYDTGFEEHWGGHASQAQCNAKHHGSCYQKCTTTVYVCTATPYSGYGSYTAESEFEWEARDRAMRQCQWQNSSCSVSCRTQTYN